MVAHSDPAEADFVSERPKSGPFCCQRTPSSPQNPAWGPLPADRVPGLFRRNFCYDWLPRTPRLSSGSGVFGTPGVIQTFLSDGVVPGRNRTRVHFQLHPQHGLRLPCRNGFPCTPPRLNPNGSVNTRFLRPSPKDIPVGFSTKASTRFSAGTPTCERFAKASWTIMAQP